MSWWEKVIIFTLIMVVVAAMLYVGDRQGPDVEMVSKTEYVAGDAGQVIVQVRSSLTGRPLTASCVASAWYPNKTALFVNETMSASGTGTYYYAFVVPEQDGVYEYNARCAIGAKNVTVAKAFHVSKGHEETLSAIREQYSIIPEGVDEVQLGRSAKNMWKILSTVGIEVQNVSCRIQYLDDDTLKLLFSEYFDRAASSVIGNGWYEQGYGNVGAWITSNEDVQFWGDEVFNGNASWIRIVKHMYFAPTQLYFTLNKVYHNENPYEKWFINLQYYRNAPYTHLGDVLVMSRSVKNNVSYAYSYCGGRPLYTDDVCGNADSVCTGTRVCKIFEDDGSNVVEPQHFVVDVNKIVNGVFNVSQADTVNVVVGVQTMGNGTGDLQAFFDDIVLVVEPRGTEFVKNETGEFGLSWVAERDKLRSWNNVEVRCAPVFTVDGEIRGDEVSQFVYISNHNRIHAVTPK